MRVLLATLFIFAASVVMAAGSEADDARRYDIGSGALLVAAVWTFKFRAPRTRRRQKNPQSS